MTLIIVEGPNCAGKTAFVGSLPYDMKLAAGPPKTRSGYEEYIAPLMQSTIQHLCDTGLVVCDRWHVGEPIYAQLFGREPIMSAEQYQKIADVLWLVYSVEIVVLLPDWSTIVERFRSRQDDLVADEITFAREYAMWNTLASVVPFAAVLRSNSDITRWRLDHPWNT